MAERGQIEFIDLKAQQSRIRESLERRIRAVLDHGAYILGPEVEELEKRLAAFSGAKHCISCANGTDALLLALMAHGVGPGDAVFVPTFTFVATAEVVSLLGATPVFVDSDPASFNIDPARMAEAVAHLKKTKPGLKPRAVIPVDLFGLPADYEPLTATAHAHGMFVLQDAAQSFGATYKGTRSGNLGDFSATSFFPAKPLGCYGDGGAVFTNDDRLAELTRSIRFHGKGADKYDNVRVGLNARLDTLQAAVLLAKMEIFEDELRARDRVATRYSQGLQGRFVLPQRPADRTCAWAQYSVLCSSQKERTDVMRKLQAKGIPTNIYYPKPLHLQGVFKGLGHQAGDFPVAERISSQILSFPMHPYLTDADQDTIIEAALKA